MSVAFSNILDWMDSIETTKVLRDVKKRRYFSERLVADEVGEMELFFLKNDQGLQPNRKALEFHKTACLIWRMAGGAEEEEEYCPDDDDDKSMVNCEMGIRIYFF
jgi:hypothetical protein